MKKGKNINLNKIISASLLGWMSRIFPFFTQLVPNFQMESHTRNVHVHVHVLVLASTTFHPTPNSLQAEPHTNAKLNTSTLSTFKQPLQHEPFMTRLNSHTTVHIYPCYSVDTIDTEPIKFNYSHPIEMCMYLKLTIMAVPSDGYRVPDLTLGNLQYFNYVFVTFLHCYIQSCSSILKVNYMNAVMLEWYNCSLKYMYWFIDLLYMYLTLCNGTHDCNV